MPTLGNVPRPAYVYDTETDTWVPVGVGAHTHAYITNTLVDAKGDIVTASASDTPAILSKGADGTVLVSDSTTSTGLAWQPYGAIQVAGKNKFINGDFSIWQRGTSFTNPTVNQYLADRWFFGGGSNFTGTISAQTFNPGAAPIAGYESTYFWRFNGSATTPVLGQRIEDVRTFAGQTVTLSFWAKANVAMSTGVFNIYQYFGSGGSNGVDNPSPNGINLTTSWARYSVTINVASISGKTIGSNSYFFPYINLPSMSSNIIDFWGWQIEVGSTATPFTTATGTIQGELAACQRYYWRTSASGFGGLGGNGFTYSTTNANMQWQNPVPMRTYPSSVDFSGIRYVDIANAAATVTSISLWGGLTQNSLCTDAQLGFSGGTSGRWIFLQANNTLGYVGFSAEL
jgi:hypothetical protein